MRWRNKILVILSVALLFLALAVAFGVYAVKTDLLWRVRDHFTRSELELKEISHDTDTVFLDELGSDPRFVLDQSLMLINAEHMLDDDFEAELTEYKTSGVMMNKAIVICRAFGGDLGEIFSKVVCFKRSPQQGRTRDAVRRRSDDGAAPRRERARDGTVS